MTVPVWVVVLAIVIIAVLALVVWSLKRRARPHLRLRHFDDPASLMRSLAGLTQGSIAEGNRLELLQNGVFFDRLFADIEGARRTISFETFLSKDGEVTRRLAAALARKAAGGVEIRLMLDGMGGRHFGDDSLKMMRDAGCTVRMYNPLNLRNLGRVNNRTHRKVVVIDGKIGYVGGHCLVDSWLGNGEDLEHFRDISVRAEGPVVAQLQSAFIDNWMEECGEVPGGEGLFPALEPAGDVSAHVVYVTPSGNPSMMKVLHYAAIHAARRRLRIQNPYFLPDPDARDALVAAVRRGVDVQIMIPASRATDSPAVQHASHHHYGTLLEAGVRIFEYQRTLLHQKVVAVDGEWASIGSSNFDDRSFEINDEVALVAWGAATAQALERIFDDDLKECLEQHYETWQRRSLGHKLIDGVTFLFNEQL